MAFAYLCFSDFLDDLSTPGKSIDPSRAWPTAIPGDTPPATEDALLVTRLRAGEESAYRDLVLSYFVPLVQFALTMVDTRADAEDVAQDVLARVWTDRAHWSPTGSIRAYLFAMVRNRAFNLARRAGVERRYQDRAHHVSSTENPDEPDERLDAIRRLVPQLTARQQTALTLRYEHGLRHAEVAQVLGVSVRAAEQLVMRALDTLRNALEGQSKK